MHRLALIVVAAVCGGGLSATAAPPEQLVRIEVPKPVEPPRDAAGARYLWPKFELGQRVVLRQTVQKSMRGDLTIACRVTAEVIDKQENSWVIRWVVSDFEPPAGLPEETRAAVTAQLAAMEAPPLELLVEEDVGVVGVRNWKEAADQSVAIMERVMKPKGGGAADDAVMRSIESARKMMATQGGAEGQLLRQVRPYFDGAYYVIAPGESKQETVRLPFAFGPVRDVPANRSLKFEAIDQAAPHRQRLVIDVAMDKAAARESLENVVRQMAERLGPEKAPPPLTEYDSTMYLSWMLDTQRGWPAEVEYAVSQTINQRIASERYTWTLVEGPAAPTPEQAK